jgi:glyoxylase-like metal-dependent hydrolase (beta-lactamase superfamily II)
MVQAGHAIVAMHHATRRFALTLAGCLALALVTQAGSRAQDSAASAPVTAPRQVQALAPGVWLLPGRFDRGRQPDGNSLLLQGPQGLVVVDSGRHAEHTQALIAWARERGEPIAAVVNTHWHLDHLGGNALLRDAAPQLRVFASPAVRDAVRRRMPASAADLQRVLADPATDADTRRMAQIDLALYARRAALEPDVLVAGSDQPLQPAGRPLRVGVLSGVSGGDLWLLDTTTGTLVVGDFVTLPVPFFDTACPAQWQRSMATLASLPFERYRMAFDALLVCSAGAQAPAACAAAWARDLGPLLAPGSERVVQGMLGYYMGERLRAAPQVTAADCKGT